MAGKSRITPHSTHPVHSVTPMHQQQHGHDKGHPAMPSGRNRIQDMPAIQLPCGNQVERGDEEPYPTRDQDGVGKQLSMRRHLGSQAASIRSSRVMVNGQWNWTSAGAVSGAGRPGEQDAQNRGGKRNQVSGDRPGDAHFDQRPAGRNARADADHGSGGSAQGGSGQDVRPGRIDPMVPAEENSAPPRGPAKSPAAPGRRTSRWPAPRDVSRSSAEGKDHPRCTSGGWPRRKFCMSSAPVLAVVKILTTSRQSGSQAMESRRPWRKVRSDR